MIMSQILGFSKFYQEIKETALPVKTAYRLAKLASAIDKEVEFYREKLTEIIKEYAELDEQGNFIYTNEGQDIKLREGTDALCVSRLQELQTLEIELPDIHFSMDDFGECKLTMEALQNIMPFITE